MGAVVDQKHAVKRFDVDVARANPAYDFVAARALADVNVAEQRSFAQQPVAAAPPPPPVVQPPPVAQQPMVQQPIIVQQPSIVQHARRFIRVTAGNFRGRPRQEYCQVRYPATIQRNSSSCPDGSRQDHQPVCEGCGRRSRAVPHSNPLARRRRGSFRPVGGQRRHHSRESDRAPLRYLYARHEASQSLLLGAPDGRHAFHRRLQRQVRLARGSFLVLPLQWSAQLPPRCKRKRKWPTRAWSI